MLVLIFNFHFLKNITLNINFHLVEKRKFGKSNPVKVWSNLKCNLLHSISALNNRSPVGFKPGFEKRAPKMYYRACSNEQFTRQHEKRKQFSLISGCPQDAHLAKSLFNRNAAKGDLAANFT